MSERPQLYALAAACGVTNGYHDISGAWHGTSDETRQALLAGMGIDAYSEEQAAFALEQLGPRELAPAREASAIDFPAPDLAAVVEDRLGGDQAFGIYANLYTLRDSSRFGIGDLGALGELVERSAGSGADFVAVNPLHALEISGPDASPYTPRSRLFTEPLYLDEVAVGLDGQDAAFWDQQRREGLIDYGACREQAMHELRAAFDGRQDSGEAADFATYRAEQGRALEDWAVYCAAADLFGDDWQAWEPSLRDLNESSRGSFLQQHASSIEFHSWLQFRLDRRLAQIQGRAQASGMRMGLLFDVAIASPVQSADVWAHRKAFASGVTLGAPPDDFCAAGQNWGLAPLNPLAGDELSVFLDLLYRRTFRHAGAVRLDHSMALVRQFWIPQGKSAAEGAYVLFPAQRMMASLSAASREVGAPVVAEDLGTVPDGFREWIVASGFLRTLVFYFEQHDGHLPHPEAWQVAANITANTHDLPPLDAWRADNLDLAHSLEGAVGSGDPDSLAGLNDDERFCVAVYRYLASTPSRLLSVALDDLAAEREPVNRPGTQPPEFRNWVRRLEPSLGQIFTSARSQATLSQVAEARRASRSR